MKNGLSVLEQPILNGWRLFSLLCALQCLVLGCAALRADLGQGADISGLIAVSVQISVPWLYLAFAASSLASLFPCRQTRWILANRRMIGLAYAAGMGWQAVFIVWLVAAHLGYYNEVADNPYDLAEEIPGYLFLALMTATSIGTGRRWLQPQAWKVLHTVGIYYLWAETWGTYWLYCFYYPEPLPIYHLYYWTGLLAWGLRLIAWSRMHQRPPAGAQSSAG